MQPSAPVSCQPQRPEPLPRADCLGPLGGLGCGGPAEGLGALGLGDGNEETVCMLRHGAPFRGCL